MKYWGYSGMTVGGIVDARAKKLKVEQPISDSYGSYEQLSPDGSSYLLICRTSKIYLPSL